MGRLDHLEHRYRGYKEVSRHLLRRNHPEIHDGSVVVKGASTLPANPRFIEQTGYRHRPLVVDRVRASEISVPVRR